jgi:SpoVK/Ycf46/Vps4 family AAA+-type ATPase
MISQPAILMSTGHNWKDIHWNKESLPGIDKLREYSGSQILSRNPKVKGTVLPYRFLFDGTDTHLKWIAAALVAKDSKKPVYRIDLSDIVSSYIGETEKNLNRIFDTTTRKDVILFFDEADALFGKRTSESPNVNAETPALPMLESFPSTLIFSAGSKSNLDQAFIRRMQVCVSFPQVSSL